MNARNFDALAVSISDHTHTISLGGWLRKLLDALRRILRPRTGDPWLDESDLHYYSGCRFAWRLPGSENIAGSKPIPCSGNADCARAGGGLCCYCGPAGVCVFCGLCEPCDTNQNICVPKECDPCELCNDETGDCEQQCKGDEVCVGDKCCPPERACASATVCCEEGDCCGGAECLQPGDQCCGGRQRCPATQTCCGPNCCPADIDHKCCGDECCPLSGACYLKEGKLACCEGSPCANKTLCCTAGSDKPICCGNECCGAEGSCLNDGTCCPWPREACKGKTVCCQQGEECVSDSCCPADRVCSGPTGPFCCPAGEKCLGGNKCCPESQACQDGQKCCDQGWNFDRSNQCCQDADYCEEGNVCCLGMDQICCQARSVCVSINDCCNDEICLRSDHYCGCEGSTCCPIGVECCAGVCCAPGETCQFPEPSENDSESDSRFISNPICQ
jgi:hypothetical protein